MKETALHSRHVESGAKMTKFGGWDMPLKFESINKEHLSVREDVGVFDVSHMGELYFEGDGAIEFMSEHCTMDITESDIYQLKYSHILNEEGGILDDTIVTRLSENSCYIVPNAGRTPVILDWILNKGGEEFISDLTGKTVMLAIQGPRCEDIMKNISDEEVTGIEFFRSRPVELNQEIMDAFDHDWPIADGPLVQRSGYTGENGFEIALPNESGVVLWDQLQELDDPPTKCGLGARDTLRLEYGFLLSGQDFDETRTSVETGWGERCIEWDHDFVGKEKLEETKEKDHQLLKGMIMKEKGIPRHGYDVFDGDDKIGTVTSGTRSPSLKVGIALGYLDPGYHEEGTEVQIEIRGEKRRGEVKNPPFV